jgi:hypothetical protein
MKINWGTGILIFIIIFLILSVVFIVFSLMQNNDLVADDYYEKGAGYSSQIAINKRSAIYTDSISIAVADTSIQIEVCKQIQDSANTVEVYFFRPSDKRNDLHFELPVKSTLQLPKTNFVHGRYIVKLSWKFRSNTYLIEKEIFIN